MKWSVITKKAQVFLGRVEKVSPIEVYVVIAVVAAFLFGLQYVETESAQRLIKVEVTPNEWQYGENQQGTKVPYWVADKLQVGQQERSAYGGVIAEIMEVENYPLDTNQAKVLLVVKLKTDYSDKSQSTTYRGQPVAVGAPLAFTFSDTMVPVQIVDANYPNEGYLSREVMVTGLARSVEPWTVAALRVGDTMRNRATGEVVATVTDVQAEPTQFGQLSEINQQQLLFKQEPDRQDLTLQVRLKIYQQDGDWYFAGNQRLRVGGSLNLQLENIAIFLFEVQTITYGQTE